jgi:hypothetical protein
MWVEVPSGVGARDGVRTDRDGDQPGRGIGDWDGWSEPAALLRPSEVDIVVSAAPPYFQAHLHRISVVTRALCIPMVSVKGIGGRRNCMHGADRRIGEVTHAGLDLRMGDGRCAGV